LDSARRCGGGLVGRLEQTADQLNRLLRTHSYDGRLVRAQREGWERGHMTLEQRLG